MKSMRLIAPAALVAGVLLILGVGTKAQQSGAASDPWSLQQNSESCYLSRSFNSVGQRLDLTIQSFGPSTPYHVILSGPILPLRAQQAETAQVSLGGEAHQAFVLVGKAGTVPMAVFAASLPRPLNISATIYHGTREGARLVVWIDPAGETLSLEIANAAPIALQLGPMAGEYERLDSCARGLEDNWRRAASPTAVPAKGPQLLHPGETNWHTKYPENLLINRVSAIAELRMTVDDKGRAKDCVVQRSTWDSRFGADSCAAFQHIAHFEPAMDSQGNPVSALYRTSVIFIIHNW